MIVANAPLRITLGGGGTDLPSYYERRGGFVISAAIDRYVRVALHRAFEPGFILKYSKTERVRRSEAIQHPILREALVTLGFTGDPGLEIASFADIPAGTGLGSSGSFTVALLAALHALRGKVRTPGELAEEACEIEINRLANPSGKQDPYAASHGGIKCYRFCPAGRVQIADLAVSDETRRRLEQHLLLFFTGYARSAADLLHDQDVRTRQLESEMLENLDFIKELGYCSRSALEAGDLDEFGRLMDVHWRHKRVRSPGMSNQEIDDVYEMALRNGATGGKLVGAGGGGFLMFHSPEPKRLRAAMSRAGLTETPFRFAKSGVSVSRGFAARA